VPGDAGVFGSIIRKKDDAKRFINKTVRVDGVKYGKVNH
jgi:hypothetical protein